MKTRHELLTILSIEYKQSISRLGSMLSDEELGELTGFKVLRKGYFTR